MDLDDSLRRLPGRVVKAVDVLGDEEVQRALLLEVDERAVRGVGLGREVIALDAVLPSAPPDVGIAHVVLELCGLLGGRVLRPDAVGAAEVGDTRLGGDARPRERDDVVGVAQPAGDGVEITHGRRGYGR